MLVAGLLAVWVAVTQPTTVKLGRRTASRFEGTHFPLWTMLGATATYLLILTGSLVTRTGASLVCPSFPNCGLDTIPDNLQSIVTIQMTHRLFAVTVALSAVILLWRLWRVSERDRGIHNFAWIITGLFLFQISLGLINIWYAIPMWSRVLHLGTATTIWTIMVILAATLKHGRDQLSELATITNGTDN
jgi:cytochrome c oxidase assembly protein subunit 15